VAGVDVDLAEVVVVLGVDAAGAHELEGTVDLVRELLVARPSGLDATNSWVQACTRVRSAKPPLVNARSRFSVDADWW
jgi:hypothetical protein